MVYIYINKYFSHDNSAVRSIIENLSTVVDDYYEILMEKNDSEVGLIPGVAKYLDNNSTYNDAFIFFREPEKVKRKFSRHIENIEEVGKYIDKCKDNFEKVSISKDMLRYIKNNIDAIGKVYENIDKKYRVIDKEIAGIIKRVERMMKSKKKQNNITDEKRETVSKILEATKVLQDIISEGTKTTLKTMYKMVVLTRLSIAKEDYDKSYITK